MLRACGLDWAQVAHEHGATGAEAPDGLIEDAGQVVGRGEILRDRVDHDDVEVPAHAVGDGVGGRAEQFDLGQGRGLQDRAHVLERRLREVEADVALAFRGEAKEQQAHARADLQDAPSRSRVGADARHRVVDPLAHLGFGDRCAGIAGDPTRGVERGIGGGRGRFGLAISLVPQGFPHPGIAGARPVRGARNHVRDQSLVAGAVFAGDDDAGQDVRVARDDGFDLAQLDAIAAQLHLVVDPAEKVDRAVGAEAREISGAVDRAEGSSGAANGSATKRSAVSSGRPR